MPLMKLMLSERETSLTDSFSDDEEGLDGAAIGTYCIWNPTKSKSKSDGVSKGWKLPQIKPHNTPLPANMIPNSDPDLKSSSSDDDVSEFNFSFHAIGDISASDVFLNGQIKPPFSISNTSSIPPPPLVF